MPVIRITEAARKALVACSPTAKTEGVVSAKGGGWYLSIDEETDAMLYQRALDIGAATNSEVICSVCKS